MRKTKEFISFLLVMCMVLSMSMTAFAATESSAENETNGGSITIENPIAGQTYTAYKIFDVTYNGDAYSYTISTTSGWYAVVAEYATDGDDSDTSGDKGLTLVPAEGDTSIYVVEVDTAKFDVVDFSATLKAATEEKTADKTETAANTDSIIFSNLSLGYYFVSSTSGALCNLTTTDPDVTIRDKNDMPFAKTDDKESAEVGEDVTYTITGEVPDTTGFTSYTYEINDTMTSGLTYNEDIAVKITGAETDASPLDITTRCTISSSTESGTTTIKLSIPVATLQEHKGKEIVITYTAKVNSAASGTTQNNSATLKYTTGLDTTEQTTPDKESVQSAQIIVDKQDSSGSALEGAKFVLMKEVITEVDGENSVTKYYYKQAENSDNFIDVEWVADITAATVKTTAIADATAGALAQFDGLAVGTYYLVETKAPVGYNLLEEPVMVNVEVVEDDPDTDLVEQPIFRKEVVNQAGVILPSTGGIGTQIFYIVGGILVVGAIVVLITRKRMNMDDK